MWAHPRDCGDMTQTLLLAQEHWNGPHGGGGWWIFAPLLWIAFFFLIVGTVRGLFWRRHRHSFQNHSARSVLAERFAKGEIDETEYRQRLNVLNSPK
jgi:putative membrane protein